MKVCKNCGEINPNDYEYCCNCGKTSFIFQEEIKCAACGAVNDKSFDHCINCGSALRQPTGAQQQTVYVLRSDDVVKPDESVQPVAESGDGFTPVPVDLRGQFSDVYGGMAVSTPAETAQCPSCGNIIPIHAIFCSKCGASVEKLHTHRVVKRKICPHCGRPNTLEASFCSYCFCSLANAETTEMQVVHDTRQVGSEIIKQAYLEDEHGKKKICTNCGSLNSPDEMFCANCGFKLDAEELKKYCPNCGAENSVDGTFCVRCQWSFDGSAPNAISKWECPECHALNDDKDTFCVVCGAKKKGRK